MSLVLPALLGVPTGCGAEVPTTTTSTPPPLATPASGGSARIPTGGITLRQLGFTNGPSSSFSVPVTTRLTTYVDQPNVVTLVFAYPAPHDVAAYLLGALPAAGFTVLRRTPDGATLAFSGHGWSGVDTSTGDVAAVTLRPGSAPP